MAKTSKTQDFGAFLTGLSASADPLTTASLEAIKTEMLAQRQEALKAALMTIKSNIDTYVNQLRETRRQETILLERIKEQEQKANDIVAGKIDLPEVPRSIVVTRSRGGY